MSNKVKFGLKNVYYATITIGTGGAVTYGTPVAIPGAVSLSLSPAGDKTEFYADDMKYFTTNANDGYEGTIEMALIPDGFKTAILGYIADTNGAIVEDSSAVPKNFAMLFEFTGDANQVRHVLYNVNAARPNMESSTRGKSAEVKTESLSITASPASDTGFVKAKMEPGDTGYDTFFNSIYTPVLNGDDE